MRALHDESRLLSGAVLCLDDVTEANRLRAELEWRASMDDLTRCHNRNAILDVLQRALLAGSDVAVVYIDVDRFKTINDRYGHAAGDRLLVGVAENLARAVRASDRIGRIGGDEFLVVCPDTIDPADALAMADRLASMLCTDHDLGPVRLPILVSIGVAHAATAGTDADALIAAADTAMYEAKRRRSGVPQLYLPRDADGPDRTAHPAAHRPRTNEDGPPIGRRRTDPALPAPDGDGAGPDADG
jgi:diguanylate cyclase (GGDEF)-like protein